MLQESQRGRYEAHRSICIRFLSRDLSSDEVIWSQVVMRVDVGDCGSNDAVIVCWNHVIDRQAAAELRRRSAVDVDDEAGDSGSGPPRPMTVVEIEDEELSVGSQRSPRRGGPIVTGGDAAQVVTTDSVHHASSENIAQSSSIGSTHGRDNASEDITTDPVQCPPSENLSFGSAGCDQFSPSGVRRRGTEEASRRVSCQSAGSDEEFCAPSGLQCGTEEATADKTMNYFGNDAYYGSSAQTFQYDLSTRDDFQVISVAKERKCEEWSLPADVVSRQPTLPAVTPVTPVTPVIIGPDQMTGTSYSTYADGNVFLTTPSPPMEYQRTVEPWYRCGVLPWFGDKRFMPYDRSVQYSKVWSHVQVWSSATTTTTQRQRTTNFFLPVFNAQEVEDVLG